MCVVFPPLLLLICMPVAVTVHAAGQHTHIQRLPQVAGAETVLPPPDPGTLVNADLHFSLPPNGIVTKVQATVSLAFPWGPTQNLCPQPGEALGIFEHRWQTLRTDHSETQQQWGRRFPRNHNIYLI
jgi:hypothetical protein